MVIKNSKMRKNRNRETLKHCSQQLGIFFNTIILKFKLLNDSPSNQFNHLNKLYLFIKRLLSFFKLDEKKLDLYALSYNDENLFSSLYDKNYKKLNIFNDYKKNSTFFKCLIYFLSNDNNRIREKKILEQYNNLEKIDHKYKNITEVNEKQNVEILNKIYFIKEKKIYSFLIKNNSNQRYFYTLSKSIKKLSSNEIKDFSKKNYFDNIFNNNMNFIINFNRVNNKSYYESNLIDDWIIKSKNNIFYDPVKNNTEFYNQIIGKNNSIYENRYNKLYSNILMFLNNGYYNYINRDKLRLSSRSNNIYNLIKVIKKIISTTSILLNQRAFLNKNIFDFFNSNKSNKLFNLYKKNKQSNNYQDKIVKNKFKYLYPEKNKACLSEDIKNNVYYKNSRQYNNIINIIKNIKLLNGRSIYKNWINKSNNSYNNFIKNQSGLNRKFQLFNSKKDKNRNYKNEFFSFNKFIYKNKDTYSLELNKDKISTRNIFQDFKNEKDFFKSLNKYYLKDYSSNMNVFDNHSESNSKSINLYKNDIQAISKIKKINYEKERNQEIIKKDVNIKHYNNSSQQINNNKDGDLSIYRKEEIMKILKFNKNELLEIINDAMKLNKRLEY